MSLNLPELFFRTRENGAVVFRVDTQTRNRRMEMTKIAVVNIRNGEVRPNNNQELTEAETEAIQNWMDGRKQVLAQRHIDDIYRAIDHMNNLTQWAQSKATDAELEAVTSSLLLTMHDLRTVLIRKGSERVIAAQKGKGEGG